MNLAARSAARAVMANAKFRLGILMPVCKQGADRKPLSQAGQFKNDCPVRAAVVVEPGLCRQSLENGNIRGCGGRLSPIGVLRLPVWESGDETEHAKSPRFRAIRALLAEPDRTPEWLAALGGIELPHSRLRNPL
jgi:hypothetical protein